MVLILSDKTVSSIPVEGLLESHDGPKKPKKIVGHTSFFKSGVCLGKMLVCCVKTSGQSIVRVMEPSESLAKSKRQQGLGRLLRGGQDSLKPYKVLYFPYFPIHSILMEHRNSTFLQRLHQFTFSNQPSVLDVRKDLRLSVWRH